MITSRGDFIVESGLWYQELARDIGNAHNYHCIPKEKSNLEIFSLRVVIKRNLEVKHLASHTIPNFIIHLLPPLILNNFLPYLIGVQNVDLNQQMKIEPGEKANVYSFNLSTDQKLLCKILYHGSFWIGTLNLTPHLTEKVILFSSEIKTQENSKPLAINVKIEKEGSVNIYFYAPYWIVNKTTLPLHFKVLIAKRILFNLH